MRLDKNLCMKRLSGKFPYLHEKLLTEARTENVDGLMRKKILFDRKEIRHYVTVFFNMYFYCFRRLTNEY